MMRGWLALVAVALALSSCSPSGDASPTPTISASPTATAAASEPAESTCDGLLTAAMIGGLFDREPPRLVDQQGSGGNIQCLWRSVDGPGIVDEDGASLSIVVDDVRDDWRGRQSGGESLRDFGDEARLLTSSTNGGRVRLGAWAVNLGVTTEWEAGSFAAAPEEHFIIALLRAWTADFLGILEGSALTGANDSTFCPTSVAVTSIAEHPLARVQASAGACAYRHLSERTFVVIRTRRIDPPRRPDPDAWDSEFTVTVERGGDLVVADHRVGCAAVARHVEVRLFLVNLTLDDCRTVQELADLFE